MSDDPRSGVVDSTCRVYGYGNLFVAGSSVFPTGAGQPPTFTIVALALRLAETVVESLRTLPLAG
jgi:choline dehydrogenase-like flavoprotein